MINDFYADYQPVDQPKIQQGQIKMNVQNAANNRIDENNVSLQQKISRFIRENSNRDFIDDQQELKRQLKNKYLSQTAINQEKKIIASKLFYFPTKTLVAEIQKDNKNAESIIFKSLVMRHGDLNLIAQRTKDKSLKAQIQYAMGFVRNWGNFYFDIKKLEKIASQKSGDSLLKNYKLDYYDLQVSFIANVHNSVIVKHRGHQITPNSFKNTILQSIAQRRLREISTNIYYTYLKKNNIHM